MPHNVLSMLIEEFNIRSKHFSDEDFDKLSLVLHFGDGYVSEMLPSIENADKVKAIKIQRMTAEHLGLIANTFPNLETLDMTMNILNEIPSSIGSFQNLRCLIAKGMAITSLPEELFELTRLEHLDISINKLTEIPSDIKRLRHLKKFSASNNKLTEINLDNISCDYINLSNNKISKLICTQDVYDINVINLSRNSFDTVSELMPIFRHGVSFLRLDLSSNKLTDFDVLGSDSYPIFTNGTICVCNCGIDVIPDIFISAIKRWNGTTGDAVFDMSFNNISSFGEFTSDFNSNSELGRKLRSNFILQGNPIDDTGFRTLDREIHIAFSKRPDISL